jgi:hypothetical protein
LDLCFHSSTRQEHSRHCYDYHCFPSRALPVKQVFAK